MRLTTADELEKKIITRNKLAKKSMKVNPRWDLSPSRHSLSDGLRTIKHCQSGYFVRGAVGRSADTCIAFLSNMFRRA
jgi:hypothetical protein